MTTERTANTSLYIPPEIKIKAQTIALKEGHSLTGIIIDLLEQYIKSATS